MLAAGQRLTLYLSGRQAAVFVAGRLTRSLYCTWSLTVFRFWSLTTIRSTYA